MKCLHKDSVQIMKAEYNVHTHSVAHRSGMAMRLEECRSLSDRLLISFAQMFPFCVRWRSSTVPVIRSLSKWRNMPPRLQRVIILVYLSARIIMTDAFARTVRGSRLYEQSYKSAFSSKPNTAGYFYLDFFLSMASSSFASKGAPHQIGRRWLARVWDFPPCRPRSERKTCYYMMIVGSAKPCTRRVHVVIN